MPSSSIYVVTNFLFPSWLNNVQLCVCPHTRTRVHHISLIYLSVKGPLVCFCILAAMNSATVYKGVQLVLGKLVYDNSCWMIFSVNSLSLELSTSCPNPASPRLSLPLICHSSGPWCGWVSCGKCVRKRKYHAIFYVSVERTSVSSSTYPFLSFRAAQGTRKDSELHECSVQRMRSNQNMADSLQSIWRKNFFMRICWKMINI